MHIPSFWERLSLPLPARSFSFAGEERSYGRGSAYAIWNLAFSLGYLVGPTVGGTLSSLLDLQTAFYVFACFLLGGTVWIYLATRGETGKSGQRRHPRNE